jgi:hypothetical protein
LLLPSPAPKLNSRHDTGRSVVLKNRHHDEGGISVDRLALALWLTGAIWGLTTPVAAGQRAGRVALHLDGPQAIAPCPASVRPGTTTAFCYAPAQFAQAASGLPFTAFDPRESVRSATQLPERVVIVQRDSYPPSNGAPFPLGPPWSIELDFGKVPAPRDFQGPPQRAAAFVRVTEYQPSYMGRPRLARRGPHGQWFFGGDISRQRMSIDVESDGPKAEVRTIGSALVVAEDRLPVRPTAPERVYVSAPHTLRVGRPATFWVLVAPRWGTYPGPGYDFDFTLGGRWSRPGTVTPDGSQACGGDNVAGQPFRRRGRWVFNWGGCPELGLILTPRTAGPHSLRIYGYAVPITPAGMVDRKHEKPAPGSGYRWRGQVTP